MSHPPASTALERVSVLDLTRVRAGPTCVRQLADWGARVIKIEARLSEAEIEAEKPERHDPDFQNLHRNKRAIALDLKSAEGVAILRRLAERADVLVENFRPDVKRRLGIDYDVLKSVNPRLVYASISGFGQDGPYRDRPGMDQIAQGMGGLMSITGEPGQGPMRAGIAVADLSAGLFAALGILVALYERESSGLGQWVQTSLLQAQIFMLDFQAARYLMRGEVPGQAGNNHPTSVPTGVYRTRDGHLNIAATRAMWPRLCQAIGRDDLIADPDFATAKARRANRDRLHVVIEGVTAGLDSAALLARLNAAGVPCGPINAIDQTFADPQVRHLGVTGTVTSAALGDVTLLAQPVALGRTPSRLVDAAPEHGEHTEAVLAELGLSAEEIAGLRRRRVI